MGEKELMKEFDKCQTLTDVYMVARTLKSKGVDALVVNNIVAKAKRNLVAKTSGVNRINKIPITFEEFPTTPVTQFYVNIQAINTPVVTIHENGEVVL